MTKPTAKAGDSQDTTSLDPGQPTIGTHRDYLAHSFRWGWVRRTLFDRADQDANRVLDAGCGPKAPMAVELAVAAPIVDVKTKTYVEYVGVDLNKIKPRVNPKWATYYEEFDFIERHAELGLFDHVVSLEVIEHMDDELQVRYLEAIYNSMKPGGHLYLSTPVLKFSAAGKPMPAKNHIRELTVDELGQLLDDAGFTVDQRYGTFASWNDIKKVITPEELGIYEQLRSFYSDNLLACFMAPAHPDASRNNLWVVRK